MTKFEEEAIKEAEKCGYVMAKSKIVFYEDEKGITFVDFNGTHTNFNFPWLEFAKNWHSDEEFQELKEQHGNQAESILLMLEEISTLKSQLQQQALPVVPEFIGKLINTFGAPEDGKHINYTASYLEIQKELDWIDNHQKTWLTALLIGFRVEKPQLFYLKHIDMSKRNSINDLYLKKYIHAALTATGEHRLAHAMSAKGTYPSKDYCAFTQQEIDSMQTGAMNKLLCLWRTEND